MFLRFDLLKKLQQLTFAITLTSMAMASGFIAAQDPATLRQASQDFTSVAKTAIPAVVSIQVKAHSKQKSIFSWGNDDDSPSMFSDDFFQRFFGLRRNQEQQETPVIGQASGFLVSSDGYIITNSHVVKDASEISVTLNDKREFVGKVVGQDPNTDIAVVKIDADSLPFIKLGNSDDLEVGQWVVTIGNPLGLQASLTVGVVSAKGRNNLDLARIEDFIQTDAAINRGNSGGPLLNLNAEAVGMNTAIVTNLSNGGYMGIGFAIPSNMIKQIMHELITTGSVTRGFLGVSLQPLDPGLARAFNFERTEGALVADITKGSPAERAGLKQGDIILRLNNQAFPNIAALRNSISLMKPGTQMTLTVIREGSTIQVPVDVGIFPQEQELAVAAGVENKYGFDVQNLTPELAQSLGYKEERGVIISQINPSGVAAWTGLKKGALIQEVNRQKVYSVEQFNKELAAMEKGKPLLLLIKQGDTVRYISLQIN
jgi:serine protease Do